MNLSEITVPVTAERLNESLARRFGAKINLGKFSTAQLEDTRNKLRTKLSQVETTESFDQVQTEEFQKNKMFLDVINAEITEREKMPMDDNGTPDDKSDDKPAFLKKKKKIKEGAEDQAELVMAAKDMVNTVTGWLEDTAEMQTESILDLADSIRDEYGSEKSDEFVNAVKPALESLYTTMTSTRETLTQAVGLLTGEIEATDDMGEPDLEPTVDAEEEPMDDMDDDFAASEPATGGEEEADRAKRESIERSKKK